jgi:hypothetical protein
VISLEEWALIRHLHRSAGLSQRAIARQLGIAREGVHLNAIITVLNGNAAYSIPAWDGAPSATISGTAKVDKVLRPSDRAASRPRMRRLLGVFKAFSKKADATGPCSILLYSSVQRPLVRTERSVVAVRRPRLITH